MFPHFLCIGARHSGTTWLHENLLAHPSVWLPPVKEIHYFNRPPVSLRARLFPAEVHLKKARRHFLRSIENHAKYGAGSTFAWNLKYFLWPRNDDWYAGLFPDRPGLHPGDITPGYARLEADMVRHVRDLMPGCRVIYLIRNPIDRSWSQTARYLGFRHGDGLYDLPAEVILDFFTGASPTRASDYLETLEIWESVFPKEQIGVFFLDDIAEDPARALNAICDFMGVGGMASWPEEALNSPVNVGTGARIPVQVRQSVAEWSRPRIEALHDRFGNRHTEAWLRSVEDLAAGT